MTKQIPCVREIIRRAKPGLSFLPLLLAFLLAASCGGRVYLVTSLSLPHAIVIDGDAQDWSGALSYIASDHLFVGFVNDRDDLFICMTKETADGGGPGRRNAWTVWFDPSGGSQKTMGLRLAMTEAPLKERPAEGAPERKPIEELKEGEPGGQPPSEERGPDLEVLGPDGGVERRLSPEAAAKEGLEFKIGSPGEAVILEIKIPLETSQGRPVAVGTGPEGLVGIGFLSSRPEGRDRRRSSSGPGMGGGGGMPGGGGTGIGVRGSPSGGMRGAMPPNMDPDISKSVKVWTRVRLDRSGQPGRSTVLGLISE